MTDTVKAALETMYEALNNNNVGLDKSIEGLKIALHAKGEKSVAVDKERLAQNNRQGRKMMQTYFKKRGVLVTFAE